MRWIPRFFYKKHGRFREEIDPDEIFFDARNRPGLDRDRFEGRLERLITKRTIRFTGGFFLLVMLFFTARLTSLQIAQGAHYRELARENRLEETAIFASRGIVYGRNGKELVWNEKNDEETEYSRRAYIDKKGFSHLLGYVSYPQADNKGIFYRTEYIGKMGVEKVYGARLGGYNGKKIIEFNAMGDVVAENEVAQPISGQNLTLSIDWRIQNELYLLMESLSKKVGFTGGAAAIMDIHTGELLALASYPEFDSSIMADGKKREVIASYGSSAASPFLFRSTLGLYAPGSIVKPFMALAGLNEGVITEDTVIVSTGSIRVQNQYYPDKYTVFWDWKPHGPLTVRDAIAVSSNVFFYEVGGGYKDQLGLGIRRINNYMHLFGLGEPTGFAFSEAVGEVPNPEWKMKNFPENPNWYLGDTYNTSIGQYGFQVTPIQMVRAIAAVANGGKLLTPTVLKHEDGEEVEYEEIDIPAHYFQVVQEGMREGVLRGTAKGLHMNEVKIAAKTGTAELGPAKEHTNSWVEGFFPYENPQYAFVVVMERGPYHNYLGGVYIMRQFFEWMLSHTPKYL